MKLIKLVPLYILLLTTVSCEKIAMHPEPTQDQRVVFDEYAKICIEKYALSEVKGVDLVALRDSIAPLITPSMSNEELFDLMSIMTLRMNEGHTNLESIDEGYYTSWWYFIGYPSANNSIITEQYYYGEQANPEVRIIAPEDSYFEVKYGYFTQQPNLGYIRLVNFEMEISDSELEEMMTFLADADGIIIDVRGNLGGYINLAARLASYFTANDVTFATNYIKNGPGEDDFAASEIVLEASGSPATFNKEVVVLHDRITFSSGSLFTIMMYSLDKTTTIGQIFGGGTGEIVDGLLANQWRYNISTSNLVDAQGRPTDNGIEADIPMVINPADSTTDALIERAFIELR